MRKSFAFGPLSFDTSIGALEKLAPKGPIYRDLVVLLDGGVACAIGTPGRP